MIKTCPLCSMNTAGQHEWDCPNRPTFTADNKTSVKLDPNYHMIRETAGLQAQLAAAEKKIAMLRETLGS